VGFCDKSDMSEDATTGICLDFPAIVATCGLVLKDGIGASVLGLVACHWYALSGFCDQPRWVGTTCASYALEALLVCEAGVLTRSSERPPMRGKAHWEPMQFCRSWTWRMHRRVMSLGEYPAARTAASASCTAGHVAQSRSFAMAAKQGQAIAPAAMAAACRVRAWSLTSQPQ
jgi:hypothetical protein